MKISTVLSVSIAAFLTACATTDDGGCGIIPTGSGASFSEQASLLQDSKSLERPTNTAAKNATPIVRIPAMIPPRFINIGLSGRCDAIFDVDKTGKVINLDVYICSSPTLRRQAIKAIETWVYEVPKENGVPTIATGLQTKINTNVADENGTKCPLQEYPT